MNITAICPNCNSDDQLMFEATAGDEAIFFCCACDIEYQAHPTDIVYDLVNAKKIYNWSKTLEAEIL